MLDKLDFKEPKFCSSARTLELRRIYLRQDNRELPMDGLSLSIKSEPWRLVRNVGGNPFTRTRAAKRRVLVAAIDQFWHVSASRAIQV